MKRTPYPELPEVLRPKIVPGTVPSREVSSEKCPDCDNRLELVKARVHQILLRNGIGTAVYMECPKCSWASPCMIVADPDE